MKNKESKKTGIDIYDILMILFKVFTADLAFVLLPLGIVILMKALFLEIDFSEFKTSSTFSFAVVILISSQLAKFIELKIFHQSNRQIYFREKLNIGIRILTLLLITSVIIMILVLIEEYDIVQASAKRLGIYGDVNYTLFIIVIPLAFLNEFGIWLKLNLKISKRSKNKAINDLINQSNLVKNNLNELLFQISNVKVEDESSKNKYNSSREFREQQLDELKQLQQTIIDLSDKTKKSLDKRINDFK